MRKRADVRSIANRRRNIALSEEPAMTGPHHRSDPEIFSAARKALDDRPSLPQDVRVHVDHGTVTLTGNVRWPQERSEAEAVVRGVEGVLRIVNAINVAHIANPEGFEPPDSH